MGAESNQERESTEFRLKRRVANLERIVEISQILNSTLSLKPLVSTIIESAKELTRSEACSIMLLDKRTGELRFSHSTDEEECSLEDLVVPLDSSVAGVVVHTGEPLLIRDAKSDSRWNPMIDDTTAFDTRSILAVPLKVKDRVIGVMELLNKYDDQQFGEDDLEIASTLAIQAAIAIENSWLVAELQNAYNELSELDQLKSEFVSIASHELRTPLSVILLYASMLREQLSGEASEHLDMVLQSAMRLRVIIDDMLNLRHVDAGEAVLERSVFCIKELITEVVNEFSQLACAKQQRLSLSLPDERLEIDADRQRIYLVLSNLLSNAVKFTPTHGQVQISAERKDRDLWVAVIDTGIGVSASEYDRIFERFYQIESSLNRRHEGIGLGLSMARSMVELHRGRIWVESVEGKGSRFTFVFPAYPEAVELMPIE